MAIKHLIKLACIIILFSGVNVLYGGDNMENFKLFFTHLVSAANKGDKKTVEKIVSQDYFQRMILLDEINGEKTTEAEVLKYLVEDFNIEESNITSYKRKGDEYIVEINYYPEDKFAPITKLSFTPGGNGIDFVLVPSGLPTLNELKLLQDVGAVVTFSLMVKGDVTVEVWLNNQLQEAFSTLGDGNTVSSSLTHLIQGENQLKAIITPLSKDSNVVYVYDLNKLDKDSGEESKLASSDDGEMFKKLVLNEPKVFNFRFTY